MCKKNRQLNTRMLVMYVITALLFIASVDLHIHTQETAATAAHGFAVDISTLSDNLLPDAHSDEIAVSPDSALHAKQDNVDLLVLFVLIAVLLTIQCRYFIGRLRNNHTKISVVPFNGVPPLRAPPL